jgi:hypothetical protein
MKVTESPNLSKIDDSRTLLDAEAEPLSISSLKLFYDSFKSTIDSDNNGFVNRKELDTFREKQNPISREHRLADVLAGKVQDIQALSRDESGFLVFSDSAGISSKDIDALSAKASGDPEQKLVKSIRADLASRNYEDVLKSGCELVEERLHFVDLKFKKSSVSLDPWKHLGNSLSAEYRTTLVGQRQFEKYEVGQALSSKFDTFGALFNLNFDTYSVSVSDKRVHSSYSWIDNEQKEHSVSAPVFDALKGELRKHGRTLIDTVYSGSTHTYISDLQIEEMNIVAREPYQRYFVDVEFRNSSFSFDLSKHIRNASTKHRVEIEVPEKVYNDARAIWDPKLSMNSMLINRRISSLHGDIKRKWTESDPSFERLTTDSGRTFVVPRTSQTKGG